MDDIERKNLGDLDINGKKIIKQKHTLRVCFKIDPHWRSLLNIPMKLGIPKRSGKGWGVSSFLAEGLPNC